MTAFVWGILGLTAVVLLGATVRIAIVVRNKRRRRSREDTYPMW